MDFIVQKSGGFCPCMRYQGLGLGEFKLELFLQERAKLLLDFFRFRLGTDEPTRYATRYEQADNKRSNDIFMKGKNGKVRWK